MTQEKRIVNLPINVIWRRCANLPKIDCMYVQSTAHATETSCKGKLFIFNQLCIESSNVFKVKLQHSVPSVPLHVSGWKKSRELQ